MDICFLFTKELNEQGCYCLTLTEDGNIISPPLQRSFSDIKSLQENCQTIVVESCQNASILDLELSWLPERKASIAIPYALEEKLAQPVEELHFAFDKLRYQNNHYTVAIVSKYRIQYIIHLLEEHQIEFEVLTLDWFALSPQELCVTDSCLLVHTNEFKGALSNELANTYKNTHPNDTPLLFQDSQLDAYASMTKSSEFSQIWLAKRLLQAKPLNLLQGEMQPNKKSDWIKKGYRLSGMLCIIWLLSIILVNSINLFSLNKKTQEIDQQISVIYHQFFPQAKQVISPKFRITQLLGSNASDSQSQFWFILNQLANAMKNNALAVQQLRYQNKTVSITLVSPDFTHLETIENNLKQLKLKVKQTQASTKDQQVVATLELS